MQQFCYLSTDSNLRGFFYQCFPFYVVDFLVYKLEAQETLNKGRVSHRSSYKFLIADAFWATRRRKCFAIRTAQRKVLQNTNWESSHSISTLRA